MTNFTTIEIPTVESLKLTVLKVQNREFIELQKANAAFVEDIPRFIQCIANLLQDRAERGHTNLELNFDDDRWLHDRDSRVLFHFRGQNSIESQALLKNLFNSTFIQSFGYKGNISFLHNSTYRLGTVYLSWA